VSRVALEGIGAERQKELLAGLATVESPRFLGIWDGVGFEYEVFDPELLRHDVERVESYLRAQGYYEARVLATRVEAVDAHRVKVQLSVREGPPVLVRSINLAGLQSLPLDVSAEAFRGMPLTPNRPFREGEYEATKRHILLTLQNAGYAFAEVTGSARVDLAAHTADVSISVDCLPVDYQGGWQTSGAAGAPAFAEGPKPAHFGPIRIEGLIELEEARVRANLGLREGARYSQDDLDDAARALLRLGVFSDVRIKPLLDEAKNNVVPILVRVEESRLRSIRVGIGGKLDPLQLSTHVALGWENRNFLDGLRNLSINTQPGLIYFPTRFDLSALQAPNRALFVNRLKATLEQPAFLEGRTTGSLSFDFNLFPVLYAQSDANSPVVGFAELRARAGLERALFSHRLRLSASFNGQHEQPVDYASLAIGKHVNANDALLDPLLITYPEVQASLDLRDNALEPRRGAYFSLNLQSALPATGSDTQDLRLRPEARFYLPISSRVTLATRAAVGFLYSDDYGETQVTGGADQAAVARTQMKLLFRGFFSGGATSNRGFALGGVGPQGTVLFLLPSADFCDDSPNARQCNQPLGGRGLWEAATELRVVMLESLSGALFIDGSNVDPDVKLSFPGYWSWGAGLRYRTPIGPLRLDVGVPFVYPDTANNVALFAMHLTLGEAF
jgi:outer membrane protein insertion porin family/translocation and assembly module TamA